MASKFGMEFYKDRILAGKSAAVAPTAPVRRERQRPVWDRQSEEETEVSVSNVDVNDHHTPNESSALPSPTTASSNDDDASYWAAYTLADSALPVGSFAHSTGLEAASQLGMLRGKDDLSTFVRTATRSTMQLTSPLIQASHRLVRQGVVHNADSKAWLEIDHYANALLVSNAPAWRASLDQGRSLLRVANKWLESESSPTSSNDDDDDGNDQPSLTEQVLQKLQQEMDVSDTVGHLGPTFGVVAALLDLSEDQACRLMGFCVARDIVSASVRLNLTGPMAGVKLLRQAQRAAEEGIVASQQRQQQQGSNGNDERNSSLKAAAGCSPVLDAIQPVHDLLAVRLFRT
jgi:urease accessory protein